MLTQQPKGQLQSQHEYKQEQCDNTGQNNPIQFNSIQFLFICMLTQQPKGQLQSELE
jgi:hypothetical protein